MCKACDDIKAREERARKQGREQAAKVHRDLWQREQKKHRINRLRQWIGDWADKA